MKNLFAEKKLTVTQIVLAVWIVFSVVYIAQSLWRTGLAASYEMGQQAGIAQMVGQTIAQASQKCEPFTLFNQTGKVDLINVACLQQPEENAEEAAQ